MSPSRRQKLLRLGVFLVPVLIVKGAGIVLDSGPMSAEADEFEDDEAAAEAIDATMARPSWSSDQLAAASHVATLESLPFGPNPIYVEVEEARADVPIMPVADDGTDLTVRLQAILTSSRGSTALISKKPYQVGETIEGTEWKLIEIRSDERAVVIQSERDGSTRTLVVDTDTSGPNVPE